MTDNKNIFTETPTIEEQIKYAGWLAEEYETELLNYAGDHCTDVSVSIDVFHDNCHVIVFSFEADKSLIGDELFDEAIAELTAENLSSYDEISNYFKTDMSFEAEVTGLLEKSVCSNAVDRLIKQSYEEYYHIHSIAGIEVSDDDFDMNELENAEVFAEADFTKLYQELEEILSA